MADPTPQSPMWWLNKLYGELCGRQGEMERMDAYYSGLHPMPFLTKAHESKMRDEFRMLLEDSRANFMRLVVDVVEERMRVEGFRLSASSDESTDAASWEIWQANQMDSESQSAFVEALVKGVSYLSIWKTTDDKYPTISVEDPLETIIGYEPGSNYRRRAAALKVWTDDWTGLRRANVFLPDAIYKFQAPADPVIGPTRDQVRWVEYTGGDAIVANPIGIVPIVPLRNRPRLLCEGESELADVFHIQNQINAFLFLLALAGYFGAHKQRWAVGLTIMEDEKTGKPKEPFDVDVGKLWVATAGENGGDVKFGEFSQTDMSGYIKAIEQKVLHIAVTSRTPRHYLIQEGQSPSGDAIESAESGLVKKVERKHRPFGEGLEEAMGIARLFNGETEMPIDSEIVWADPATESQASLTDAVMKQYGEGLIPWSAALEKLGYSPNQIRRFEALRLQDTLLAGTKQFAPPPAPAKTEPPLVTP